MSTNSRYKFVRYVLPPILWAAVIFILSSIPSASLPGIAMQVNDLVAHFLIYTVLGYLIYRSFLYKKFTHPQVYWGISIIIGIICAASDEFHQSFVVGRQSEMSDWLADSLGVMVGTALFKLQYRLTYFDKN